MRVAKLDKSKCLVCEISCHQKGLAFFKFPQEQSRLEMWAKEISPLLDLLKIHPNSLKNDGRICAKHFRETDFINSKQDSLVRNACPSLNISNLSYKNNRRDSLINKEVFMEKTFSGESSSCDGNEKDVFQCGRCKAQFEILSEFVDHKRCGCTSTEISCLKVNETSEPEGFLEEKNVLPSGFSDQFSEMVKPRNFGNSQEIITIADKELHSGNEISISAVPNEVNESGVPNGFSAMSTSILLVPQLLLPSDEALELTPAADVVDLSLASVRTPAVDKSSLPKNCINETHLDSLIVITAPDSGDCPSKGLIYAYSVESGGMGFVVTPATAVDQVALSSEISESLEDPGDVKDAFLHCGSSDPVRCSQDSTRPSDILPESGKGEVETFLGAEENGPEKTKTRLLPCPYCGKAFEKPFNLQQHERVHTGERPFQCIVCGRAFTQKSNVRKHMKRHKVWPEGKQTLSLKRTRGKDCCGDESLDRIDYSCQYCSSRFKSYAEHKKHLAVHSDVKVYRCIQKSCDETFSDLDEFLSHSRTHSSAEFWCHICFRVFTDLEGLGVHQYDHDSIGKKKVKEIGLNLKCKVCHARFKSAESLKNHLAVDNHRYECVRCNSVFCSERFLRRHLFTHVDSSKSKFECQNCKKIFRTQQNLRNHAFVHLKEKPFTCDHCLKQFASKYRLKRHLAVHMDQYIECPLKKHLGCDKTFYRKDKLRDHLSTHGHRKPWPCRTCSKTYRTSLRLHRRVEKDSEVGRHRRKEKAVLRCSTCFQTFRKQKRLMQHNCTVEERPKFQQRESREAVSNIEIIMVPFDSSTRNAS